MPLLELKTNVKVADPRALALALSKFAAELFSKSEAQIAAHVAHDAPLSFAGSFEPAFVLSVINLSHGKPTPTEAYSKALFDFLGAELGVPGNRGFIAFIDPGSENLGYMGSTVAAIRARK